MRAHMTNLGQRARGDIVAVTLHGTAANVVLLDAVNFSRYRRGRQFKYVGTHVTQSPVRLTVPHDGHWRVVVDHGGRRGRTHIVGVTVTRPVRPARR